MVARQIGHSPVKWPEKTRFPTISSDYLFPSWNTGMFISRIMNLLVIIQFFSMCQSLSSLSSSSSPSFIASHLASDSQIASLQQDESFHVVNRLRRRHFHDEVNHHHRQTSDTSIVNYFITHNTSINFTHLAFDARNDRIYVGASNWLYQFNSDTLKLDVALDTGPVVDSPTCSASGCSGVESPSMTTNINKVLVIDEYYNKLIVCGSVHQGACRRHSLKDISNYEDLIPVAVASNDENSSTFAFIGPAKYYGRPVKPVLYVGTTNSRLGSYRGTVPAMASRSLEATSRLFSVVENSFSDIALVDIESHLKDYYLVKYVYGFYSQDFVYFAILSKRSHLRALEEWGYVTRLARICATDAAYNTYTEITLVCTGSDGSDYNILQDAVTVSVGQSLADDLNIPKGATVLIGVFSASKDHTWNPSERSGVCIYSMEEIEQKFNENIHLCFNGSTLTRNMDYIAGNIKDCPEPGGRNVASFCGETLKLNGSIPITARSAIEFNETLTAVTGLVVGQYNVALLGTSKGRVKKILIASKNEAEQFEETVIDPGKPILQDMLLDRTNKFVFAASPYKMVKLRVDRCVYHRNCSECLGARNPFCKTCILDRRYDRRSSNCPSFRMKEQVMVPDGAQREIAIHVVNVPNTADKFECIIEIEGARARIPARLNGHKVVCMPSTYTYQTERGQIDAHLSVLWDGDTFIDKSNVTIYKCHLLGSHQGKPDCSLCQALDRKYQCVWCSGTCTFVDACADSPLLSCPPPRIDSIYPLSGPVEGGTQVTIEGSNLGSSIDDVKGKISIGGIPCTPIEYNVSVRVVCLTRASVHGPMEADIVIKNRVGETQAQEKFSYKVVQLLDINPKVGPKSGGTNLYISGSNLNVGLQVSVLLDGIPCQVKRTIISNRQITCRTPPAPTAPYWVQQLTLYVDGANLSLPQPFTYGKDPIISAIFPNKSYLSGGRSIFVSGDNFLFIQQPKILVKHLNRLINESVCLVVNETLINCPSPSVQQFVATSYSDHIDLPLEDHLVFQVAFEMDGVESVQNLGENLPNIDSTIHYVPNPKIRPFDDDGIKLYQGDSLVIEGEHMKVAASEGDISVMIGTWTCNVTSITNTHLVCTPPEVQPPETDELGRGTSSALPAVVILIGSNIREHVGYLRYQINMQQKVSPLFITVISAVCAIIMVLSLVLLAFFRYESSQAERECKRIQLQMDSLENSVRSECKQAFAELQTDLIDLNNDIQATGIPIFSHKAYIMKVFFPGLTENPLSASYKLLNGHAVSNDHLMVQFDQLINTQSFLLTFITSLDNQSSFTIRDRVHVASLLMAVLLDRMDYAFRIIRHLLLRLIAKYANSKYPQLLLRRTEFIVEKMLVNWIAICMHNYLKEDAGRALYLLFSAIKHQIEKGPVDAITHDARYSLSEDRLLRDQIEYTSVTLNVLHEGKAAPRFQVKVLDVDTISQVKSKILDTIYKNAPYSTRPSIHDMELEWRKSDSCSIVLADDDGSGKLINGWKRLNTLAYYRIKDRALICLMARRGEASNHVYETIPNSPSSSLIENLSIAHYQTVTNSSQSNIYYTLSKRNPINFVTHKNCDNNIKYWHLVKNGAYEGEYSDNVDVQSRKAIPEIYLTRLLSTKGTIQKFVDDFFTATLSVKDSLPSAVKWLFDLFDQTALEHGITDPETVHAWKSNSLPLRFWVNLVKNPDFIFDVEKSPVVDSCLSVITQTFMDACSAGDHRLGKDSPASKLLFARDISVYRCLVSKFYNDVAGLPHVSDDEMIDLMKSLSNTYSPGIKKANSLKELYFYAVRYRDDILEALYLEPECLDIYHQVQMITQPNQAENFLI